MWLPFALLTFLLWGIADFFYKKGNPAEDGLSHWKTIIIVGIVMGIHAFYILASNSFVFDVSKLVIYLPVSLCYILSMGIGYAGLRYIELSIASPVQNSSGAIATILCMIFCSYVVSSTELIGIICMLLGVFFLTFIETKNPEQKKIENKKYHLSFIAILMPISYCVIDGLGTFLDALYLDEFAILSEVEALIAYEFTFFVFAVIGLFYVCGLKKEKISLPKEKNRCIAAIFETAGQFFYTYAMASNSTVSAALVSSYCILSLLLSRIFLKENLSQKQYALIILVTFGIILTSI